MMKTLTKFFVILLMLSLLPVVFVAYGIGFVYGVIESGFRKGKQAADDFPPPEE